MDKHFDQQTYQTGHTPPPKNKGGLIAALLVIIILLGGVVSILSLVNIRMFRKITGANKETQSIAVVADSNINSTLDTPHLGDTLELEHSPTSIENYLQEEGLSLQQLHQLTAPSIVTVKAPGGSSTGVVLTAQGYVLTNCHILADTQEVTLTFYDGTQKTGVLTGRDSLTDLAVVKVEAEDLVPAHFGDSSVLRVGDPVVAMGDPVGTEVPMTNGIISAITNELQVGDSKFSFLHHTASNQNGPLFNCYGQIIGFNGHCAGNVMSLAATNTGAVALDCASLKEVTDQLIAQGFVSGRVYLGIRGHEVNEFYEQYYHIPKGIFITGLDKTSALYLKGVREGDILLSLDGTSILCFDTLNNLLSKFTTKQEVTAVIYRDGQQQQITVTIGAENSDS